jgi:tetratricopeptide (TPR) repeat protein
VWVNRNVRPPQFFAPTATPTLPARDLEARMATTLENGNINDYLTAMQAYIGSVPNEREYHALYAQTLIMRNPLDPGNRSRALAAADAAINASPETPEGWVVKALVLDWSDENQKALGYALRAKELGDESGMAQAVMAGIYFTLNDLKQASSLADAAIKQNPNLAYPRFVKGQMAQFSGDPKTAIRWYKEGLTIWENDRRQWGGYIAVALAQVYSAQNQSDQATKALNESLPRDKDFPGLVNQLANIYYKDGDYLKALETALGCTDRNPDYAPCYVVAMRVHYRDGLWEKAAQAAKNAIDRGTQETAPYYYGGEALRKMNNCDEAKKLFQAGRDLAIRLKKDVVGDFNDALTDCGDTTVAIVEPTATPTIVVTPTRQN